MWWGIFGLLCLLLAGLLHVHHSRSSRWSQLNGLLEARWRHAQILGEVNQTLSDELSKASRVKARPREQSKSSHLAKQLKALQRSNSSRAKWAERAKLQIRAGERVRAHLRGEFAQEKREAKRLNSLSMALENRTAGMLLSLIHI